MYIVGCSGIFVNYDYDEQTNFTAMKSFDWLPIPENIEVGELTMNRFKDAITTQLEIKGMDLTSESPDFSIVLHFGRKNKIRVRDVDYGYGYRYRGWGSRSIHVDHYEEGTVIVDFIDAQSRELFWRGVAKGWLFHDSTPEEQRKKARKVAEEVLKNFPPH